VGKGFPRVELGKVCIFQNGKSIKPGGNGVYPVYGSNGLIGNSDEYREENGLILGRVGAYCGSVEYCPGKFWASDNTIVCYPRDGKCGVRFLYYLLGRLGLRRWAGGAAQPLLTQTVLKQVEAPVPLLPTQQKIASILSAYDDLIENNTRRIKILEEMAQAIYHHWFVDFKFPGHKKVKMVDSPLGKIPEGWEVKKMQEITEVIDCLHSIKPKAIEAGFGILLQLFNIVDGGKLDMAKKYLISESDYKLWTSRIEVKAGDCVVTNVGRIAAVAQVPEELNAALGRNMTGIRPKKGLLTPTFLIEYLLSPHMEKEVHLKKDAGSIMDSLNVKGIIKLCVLVPPYRIMELFERTCRPIRKRIELLMTHNLNLRRTRDLLLPKLISGEINVSTLEIESIS
jgi:type I restriction enzyme, S subunit